ncbi:hypothetical protein O9929_21160 [Vibrio lentus]|nr:hypothetical protein [Vibrio lentus]
MRHAFFSAGDSAISLNAELFQAVKMVGAVYLIWLGCCVYALDEKWWRDAGRWSKLLAYSAKRSYAKASYLCAEPETKWFSFGLLPQFKTQ